MMQLYAFDLNGGVVSASRAHRKTDYHCLECQQIVRLRGGPHRQSHFFHIEPTPFCRQHQKGAIHLQLQSYFHHHLPQGDCQLECPFPEIGRIADVAWQSEKIVFEIQCSPISAEEVMERNRDYQMVGWQVVWILHDNRYNQFRLSGAELALRSSPHFFSNMNASGNGIIYDQFDICDKGLRFKRLPPFRVKITEFKRVPFTNQEENFSSLLLLKERLATWKLSFNGDLLSSFYENRELEIWNEARKLEREFCSPSTHFTWTKLPIQFWKRGVVRPYQIFFRYLLERICRS